MPRQLPRRRFFEGDVSACIGRALGRAAERRLPACMLTPLVKAYVACLGVDMSQVQVPAGGFGSFGAFFARRLRPDARPVFTDPCSVVSPCDSVVVGQGRIDAGATSVLVIKNTEYVVQDLIADATVAAGLAGGGFCLFYLHPRDCHRVHIPVDSTLSEARYIPGARYPMAPWASPFAGGALGKNERVVFDLELPDDGRRCVLVMVAAFGVGGIECQHVPPEGRQPGTMRRTALAVSVTRGDEIGAFRLGSTVALLWPGDVIELDEALGAGGRVLAGQRVGRVRGRASGSLRPKGGSVSKGPQDPY